MKRIAVLLAFVLVLTSCKAGGAESQPSLSVSGNERSEVVQQMEAENGKD